MPDFNIYELGQGYVRFVNPLKGLVKNISNGTEADDTAWEDSVLPLTFNQIIGGFEVTIPALTIGAWDMIFYNCDPSAASAADEPGARRRMNIKSSGFDGNLISL